jgi:hypothetical protein
MKRSTPKRLARATLAAAVALVGAGIRGQDGIPSGYTVDQRVQWVASITDPALIQTIVDELYINESRIDRIEVIDANNNGFSSKDLIKTFPSETIYFLEPVSESLQNEMNHWKFQANFSILANSNQTPERMEKIPVQKAEYAIVASFLRGVTRNYLDVPLKVWIERDSLGMNFQMWGYSDQNLQYNPSPPSGYDLIYVYRSVADTLIVPK